MATITGTNIGHVTQIIGSTFDAEFGEDHLPDIYNALKIDADVKGTHVKVTGEVQQHLGERLPAGFRTVDQEAPDQLGAGRAARLSRRHGIDARTPQPLDQRLHLGRLAGPFPAFEGDEASSRHPR